MSFGDDMRRFTRKVEVTSRDAFIGVATAARDSIVEGSPITGAPGQPVDTGFLRASWQLSFPSATSAEITTNCEYAEVIEDNIRGVTFRNHGPHSVKLTLAGMDQIVEHVTREVGDG